MTESLPFLPPDAVRALVTRCDETSAQLSAALARIAGLERDLLETREDLMAWKAVAMRARRDADDTAKPRTRLLARQTVQAGDHAHAFTPNPATHIEDTETGERVSLHDDTRGGL